MTVLAAIDFSIGKLQHVPKLHKLALALRAMLAGDDVGAQTQRSALFTFAIRVAGAALLYLMQIVLARVMGTAEFGVFAYVWTCVVLFGAFTCLGVNESVKRFVPQYLIAGKFDHARGFIWGMYGLTMAFATAMSGLGALGIYLFEDLLTNIYVAPLYLALICVPIYTLMDIQAGEAIGRSRVILAMVPPYVLRPLLILVFMGTFVLAGMPATAATAMLAAIAALWVATAYQFIGVRRGMAKELPRGPRRYRFKEWLTVSLPLFMVEGFYMLATNVDVLILSSFVEPDQIALYYAGLKTMALVVFVHYALSQVSARRFAEYDGTGDRAQLGAFYSNTIKWTFWPSLLATAGMVALGKPFLWLFGPDFVAAYPVILVLAVGLIIQSAAGPVAPLLNMIGKERLTLGASGIGLVINIGLNIALIPIWGLIGAAVATTIGGIVQTCIMAYIANRYTGAAVLFWRKREI